jgi:hypothetical protein
MFLLFLVNLCLVIIIRIGEPITTEAISDIAEQIIITKADLPHRCNLIMANISCQNNKFTDFEGSVFIQYSSSILEGKEMVVVTITPLGYFETKDHFTDSFISKKWIKKEEFEGNDETVRALHLTMEDELFKNVKKIIAYCLNSLLDASILLERKGNENCYNLIVKSNVAPLLRGFFEKDRLFNDFLRNFVVNNLNAPKDTEGTSEFSEEKVTVLLSTVEPIKWQIGKYE